MIFDIVLIPETKEDTVVSKGNDYSALFNQQGHFMGKLPVRAEARLGLTLSWNVDPDNEPGQLKISTGISTGLSRTQKETMWHVIGSVAKDAGFSVVCHPRRPRDDSFYFDLVGDALFEPQAFIDHATVFWLLAQ